MGKLVKSNLCLIDMKHDFNLTLKMYKVVFSYKQITEIKKKMHIDHIFTYSDPEIALKVYRNKLRIKLNRRPLWGVYMVHGKSRLQGYKNPYGGSPLSRYLIHPLFWGVLGAWMTFNKVEM